MALIDKETIRKEIERRIKVAKVEYESTHAPEYEGIDIELNALLAFLDTLPEHPVEIHIDNPNIEKIDPSVKVETRTDGTGDIDDGKAMLYVAEKSYKIGYRDGKARKEQPMDGLEDEPKKPDKFPGITRFCDVADNLTRIASGWPPAERATMQDFNYHDGEPDKKALGRLIAILNYAEATSDDTPVEEVQALIDWIDGKQKEQPVEGLEKEIDKYFDGWLNDAEYGQAVMPDCYCAGVDDCKDIARHFAEWGAEHLKR